MERSGRASGGALAARKWAVGLGDGVPSSVSRDVPDPAGFSRSGGEQEEGASGKPKKEVDATWKQLKAWEVAQAPVKNLFMMAFMMWMAGSGVHLFSIGITFSALWQPISALQGLGKAFEPFKDARVDMLLPKLTYIAVNVAGLGLGLWKLNSLGLLPTHASDWVSNLPPPLAAEVSGGGLPLYSWR